MEWRRMEDERKKRQFVLSAQLHRLMVCNREGALRATFETLKTRLMQGRTAEQSKRKPSEGFVFASSMLFGRTV